MTFLRHFADIILKIQDAVELLRDPSSRTKLDKYLNSKVKRQRDRCPSDDWSTRATDSDSERSPERSPEKSPKKGSYDDWFGARTKPYRRSENPSYVSSTFYQQQRRTYHSFFKRNFEDQPKRQRQQQQESDIHRHNKDDCRYAYSFGNSVHMDPESAESKATRAQFRADNLQWEQEWAGIDPNAENIRAEARKQAMRDRVARDAEELLKAEAMAGEKVEPPLATFERAMHNAVNGMSFAAGFGDHTNGAPPDILEEFQPFVTSEFVGNFDHQHPCEPKSENIKSKKPKSDKEDPIYFEDNSSAESPVSDKPCYSSPVSNPSAPSHASTNYSGSSPERLPFPGCFPNQIDLNSRHPVSEQSDIKSTVDDFIDPCLIDDESNLGHLASMFRQKLADPSGRYTTNDMASELNGVVLESYSSWLEDVRLSIPGATPATVRNAPENCSHLGAWYKEYGRPQCDICLFYMPIFILTCPGCGLKACALCKFTGDPFAPS